jgi:predicted GIY-YIG superfamily endonuclease
MTRGTPRPKGEGGGPCAAWEGEGLRCFRTNTDRSDSRAAGIIQRVSQHREGLIPGFTKTHGLKRLVWFESHESMVLAIHREKLLKKYKRDWKTNLIERDNPHWDDLYPTLIG